MPNRRKSSEGTPSEGYVFRASLVVGTSRCDVPGRVQRAERTRQDVRAATHVAPLYAARTAQRAVPTPPALLFHQFPLFTEEAGQGDSAGKARGDGLAHIDHRVIRQL